jgi:hypothetical protein
VCLHDQWRLFYYVTFIRQGPVLNSYQLVALTIIISTVYLLTC